MNDIKLIPNPANSGIIIAQITQYSQPHALSAAPTGQVVSPTFETIEYISDAKKIYNAVASPAITDSLDAWKLNPPAEILFVKTNAPKATTIAIQNALDCHNEGPFPPIEFIILLLVVSTPPINRINIIPIAIIMNVNTFAIVLPP